MNQQPRENGINDKPFVKKRGCKFSQRLGLYN